MQIPIEVLLLRTQLYAMQCKGLLKNEYTKFQETHDKFCKDKAAHMQNFKGMQRQSCTYCPFFYLIRLSYLCILAITTAILSLLPLLNC